jgi:hypothetical protein
VVVLTIDPRYRGPDTSGNGGYTCGLVAGRLDGDAEVTLRLPPPLGRPLRIERDGARVTVLDGDAVVAEAEPTTVELELPAPVSFANAEAAALPHGDPASPFPHCFVCGRDRDDGLRLFPGPVPGRDVVAAAWVPEESRTELVWAALDCPGAYGSGAVGRGDVVLGRLAAHVERLPEPGERCVVVGWGLGEDGRKVYAGTAVYAGEEPLAWARATWIVPR